METLCSFGGKERGIPEEGKLFGGSVVLEKTRSVENYIEYLHPMLN